MRADAAESWAARRGGAGYGAGRGTPPGQGFPGGALLGRGLGWLDSALLPRGRPAGRRSARRGVWRRVRHAAWAGDPGARWAGGWNGRCLAQGFGPERGLRIACAGRRAAMRPPWLGCGPSLICCYEYSPYVLLCLAADSA